VVCALALSIPISVYSSRVSVGRAFRRAGLLLIPEEVDPPGELRAIGAHANTAAAAPGFVDAVVNPHVNAIASAVSCARTKVSPRAHVRRQNAVALALKEGPQALTDRQKLFLLSDALALSLLHFDVWTSAAANPGWLGPSVDEGRGEYAALPQAS
jgi:membrane glycosyltransferase